MPTMATLSRQADPLGIAGGEIDQTPQRLGAKMRLVSQDDGPVGQAVFPPAPSRSALNGTEHASPGSRVPNPVNRWNTKAVEFGFQESTVRGANDGDLFCAQNRPLFEQAAKNGGSSPRQQQLGTAHANGASRAQDHDAQSEFAPRLRSLCG